MAHDDYLQLEQTIKKLSGEQLKELTLTASRMLILEESAGVLYSTA